MVAAQGISAAERLLFDTNHMQGIEAPITLTYSYQKEAAGEDGFKDEVKVDITRINPDATVAVTTQFLSGDRNVPLPAIEGAHGNPAVLGFLERDIVEMKRLTGGSTGYFRKGIRRTGSAHTALSERPDARALPEIRAQGLCLHLLPGVARQPVSNQKFVHAGPARRC